MPAAVALGVQEALRYRWPPIVVMVVVLMMMAIERRRAIEVIDMKPSALLSSPDAASA